MRCWIAVAVLFALASGCRETEPPPKAAGPCSCIQCECDYDVGLGAQLRPTSCGCQREIEAKNRGLHKLAK